MKKLFALILVAITVILSFGIVNVSASSGYVTISFQDYGIRGSDKGDFPHQLGKIINKTKVKINKNDTIATVTLRLLKEKGIKPAYTGKPEMGGGFYLASIDNFTTVSGKKVSDGYGLGEFSVGSESGWMISYNNWFINKGASEFYVMMKLSGSLLLPVLVKILVVTLITLLQKLRICILQVVSCHLAFLLIIKAIP